MFCVRQVLQHKNKEHADELSRIQIQAGTSGLNIPLKMAFQTTRSQRKSAG